MTTPPHAPRARRRGFRDQQLWILAAVLGAATVHAVASVVHDRSQRRAAAQLVTHAAAERVAFEAARRIEVMALQATAPAISSSSGASAANAMVGQILEGHRRAKTCRCQETLPIQGAFALTESGEQEVKFLAGALTPTAPERLRTLQRVAASALVSRRDPSHPGIRLHTDSSLGPYAATTVALRDTLGVATAVVGLIIDAEATLDLAFGGVAGSDPVSHPSGAPLVRLDHRSVEVREASGRRVFGASDSTRRFHATVSPHGVLGDLRVSVSLATAQIASPLVAPVASNRIWHLFAMMVSTAVTIGLALRSSRRETLIARSRADFVAGVSHELRMPLAQILLASETLAMRRERNDAERVTLSSSILREARRLVVLVENVLLFSRAGSVELRPHLEPVALDELIPDVVEAVELALHDAGQTIDVPRDPALAVVGDRRLLRQALVNLVDNAMKYGGSGQRIRVLVEPHAQNLVRLVVEDAGRGVPAAERARVFAPYERLQRDQDSVRTGTGLGLAIVRQIAEACHGRVWLEDSPSGGTRAVLELPAAERVAEAATA